VDLGDVLFKYSASTQTSISPKILKKIIHTPTWQDFECGRISEETCYKLIAEEFSTTASEVRETCNQAGDSIIANHGLFAVIRELKDASNGSLRIYAMSNLASSFFAVLRDVPADWAVFDDVFISGEVGIRKPDLGFYHHVLGMTDTDPSDALFIDDKAESILAASSLGIHGVLFDDTASVARILRTLFGDSVRLARDREFLSIQSRKFGSTMGHGPIIRDSSVQYLVVEAGENG
jgi:FMN phosphatase YigB (HAD superfamily)